MSSEKVRATKEMLSFPLYLAFVDDKIEEIVKSINVFDRMS